MSTPSEHNPHELTLVVRRLIPAAREEVFAAWTDPDSMALWMCPGDIRSATARLDVRVGGKLHIVMKGDDIEYEHTGEYRVVEPPSKLAFTWISEGTDHQPTLVTVELLELGRWCELVLTHENFVKPDAVQKHKGGWTSIAGKLAAHFEKRAKTAAASDFCIQLKFPITPRELYQQLATAEGIGHWWTKFCEMEESVGGKAVFRFPKADFYAVVKILKLEPPCCVEWLCTDSKHPEKSGFSNLRDWVGTTLRFEIAALDAKHSQLTFTHAGLASLECFGVCSNTWSFYLNDSLRDYLERGGGKPYTDGEA